MTHFGITCPAATGHFNTFLPLGQNLKKRGHEVTLIGVLDSQPKTVTA
jgi:UDP:flavonoid glycosyltransferase YjiC (YdhE family)